MITGVREVRARSPPAGTRWGDVAERIHNEPRRPGPGLCPFGFIILRGRAGDAQCGEDGKEGGEDEGHDEPSKV